MKILGKYANLCNEALRYAACIKLFEGKRLTKIQNSGVYSLQEKLFECCEKIIEMNPAGIITEENDESLKLPESVEALYSDFMKAVDIFKEQKLWVFEEA